VEPPLRYLLVKITEIILLYIIKLCLMF